MNYNDLLAALPEDVRASLEAKLDALPVTEGITKEEVRVLFESAVDSVHDELTISEPRKLREVQSILFLIASAGVAALFA